MKTNPLVIALDYDDTYSADPDMFLMFALAARTRGHTVHIVTMREPRDVVEEHERITSKDIQIFYTSGEDKDPVMKGHGIDVDIWIDDNPRFVGEKCPYLD